MIVWTPSRRSEPSERRPEIPLGRSKVIEGGIACPSCGGSTRLTAKEVEATGKTLIFCGLCGGNFWEDEGVRS